ncbi:MAG: hypothetical protein V9H69_01580 [Anaerolineae bacterium]|jgi:hypothetical protein
MKKLLPALWLAAAGALLINACSAPAAPLPAATLAAPDPAFQSPAQPEPAADSATRERGLAQPAIDDLSSRLAVASENIAVIEINEMDWPDASLGCPAPDMAYAQVITPGAQVILESGGQTYDYRGRTLNDLFLCGPDGPVPPMQ